MSARNIVETYPATFAAGVLALLGVVAAGGWLWIHREAVEQPRASLPAPARTAAFSAR